MTPLEIQNYNQLIDSVMLASKQLLDGNADAIFDGVHDPVQLWYNCGQCKAVIQMFQHGAISAAQCGKILHIFDNKYRQDIQCILNNVGEENG